MANASLVDVEDTIVAIGSSPSPAERGAVRLSGSAVLEVLHELGIEPRTASSAHFVDGAIDLGDPLGEVAVRALVWPTARSYTGQPSLELHTVGSLPILQAIVQRSVDAGARAARPGEFTLRAFLAGRLDLTQAEAVLGVIEAEGRGSLDHALRQLAGNLSRPMESMRNQLLDLLADVEAGLDFVDEDIQFISDDDLIDRLEAIACSLAETAKQITERSREKSEWTIALRGLPNAGKSRLLNELVGRDAAIVADVAGTTRDVVTVPTRLAANNGIGDDGAGQDDTGHDVVFVDTAGVETISGDSASEEIARQAQLHADRAGREADIRLWCVDFTDPRWSQTRSLIEGLAAEGRRAARDLWVATKCDQIESADPPSPWIAISAVTGAGLDQLRRQIAAAIDSLDQNESGSIAGTASRCQGSLRAAESAIESAIRYVRQGDGHEYVSAEIRLAARAIGEVTGAVYNDDILDRVFSRFCIGK